MASGWPAMAARYLSQPRRDQVLPRATRGMSPLSVGITLVALLIAAAPAAAVSITDVLVFQNQGVDSISLGAHPGATVNPTSPGSTLLQFGIVTDAISGTLTTTFQLVGQAPIPFNTSLVGVPATYVEGFDTGPCCLHPFPTAGSLTVNFTNGTQTDWQFSFVDPVPEPATVLLAGTALALAWWRRRRTPTFG
jgi:PEP-CTERM motif-containing protein